MELKKFQDENRIILQAIISTCREFSTITTALIQSTEVASDGNFAKSRSENPSALPHSQQMNPIMVQLIQLHRMTKEQEWKHATPTAVRDFTLIGWSQRLKQNNVLDTVLLKTSRTDN